MIARMPRQAAIVGALAVVLAIVYYAFAPGGGAEQTAAPRTSSNPAGRGRATGADDMPVVDLGLERLHEPREALPETNRNPFRFRPAPPPPAPAPSPRDVSSRPPLPKPEVFAPPAPAGPPAPPPIPLKFFGFVVVNGERHAAFTDTRGNTFHGKEGDIIEGRYRVLRIGPDTVEIAYLDGRGRRTLSLTGQ
jgi:hypothetical protein